MFRGSCEQSLVNYIYNNYMINKLGFVIIAHHFQEGEIIACPEYCNEEELRQSD